MTALPKSTKDRRAGAAVLARALVVVVLALGFAAPLALGQFARADARGVENLFGQFAESLAGHVHAGEGCVAIALPLCDAPRQAVHVRVAQRGKRPRGSGPDGDRPRRPRPPRPPRPKA